MQFYDYSFKWLHSIVLDIVEKNWVLSFPSRYFCAKYFFSKQKWRFQFVFDHNLGHFEANSVFDRAEIVMEAGKNRLFSIQRPRTKFVAKTPIPHASPRVRVSLLAAMSVCGKNVDTLRACKWSNREFLRLYTGNTYILSSSLSITRGVLRFLLGFLALWGQKPCGGN